MNNNKLLIILYYFSIGIEQIPVLGLITSYTLSKIFGIFLLLSFFLNIVSRPSKFISKKIIISASPVIIFAFILIINNFLHFDKYSESLINVQFMFNLVSLLVIANEFVKDPKTIELSLLSFSIGVMLMCVLLILGLGVQINSDGRHTVFQANHNELALKFSIVCGFILSFLNIYGITFFKKLSMLLILLSLAYGILLTGSRSGLLVLTLLLFVFITTERNIPFIIRMAIFIIVAWLILFTILESEALSYRLFNSDFSSTKTNDILGGRLILWRDLSSLFSDRWILGVGRSGYEHASYLAFGNVSSPHNVILESFIYTGLVGAGSLILFLLRLTSNSLYCHFKGRDNIALFILISLLMMAVANQILSVKVFWIMSAVIWGRYLSIRMVRDV